MTSDGWNGFVYVLGRLINVADGHFGIKPDELRHGTSDAFAWLSTWTA